MRVPTRWLPAALLVLSLALAGCGGGESDRSAPDPAGSPRSFALGLGSLPSDLTEQSYAETFELAASAGEVILIRRAPPWEELLAASAFPSKKTAAATQREVDLARVHDLDIFLAVDVTDVSEETGQLAGLPDDLRGATFADEEVRKALISYAQYVAVNWRPRFLALGVDVNQYFQRNPADFDRFVSLYEEAYDVIKAEAPETLIFPTFQLEELQGRLPVDSPRPPQWDLIDRFDSKMDLLAVSSYPGLAFDSPGEIPDDYYSRLASRTDLPIVIAETGYPSQAGRSSRSQGSEEAQAAFLRRVLTEAEQLDMALVVWFVGRDPTFTGGTSFDLLQHIGLLRQDGTEKPAWSVWSRAARQPLAGLRGTTRP